MAFVHVLPLGDLVTSFAIAITGAGLLLATGVAIRSVARRLGASFSATVIAVCAMLSAYALVFWTLRGMEVGLLACLATSGVLLLVRLTSERKSRDLYMLLGVVAASLLTRTDAVVFVVAWIAYAGTSLPAAHRRCIVVALVVVTVGTLVGHTLVRLALYGAAMPNTYYLKLEGIPLDVRLYRGACSLLYLLQHGWLVPCALAACAFVDRQQWRLKLLLAAQVASCAAYSIFVGGDAWEELSIPNRYLAPSLPALFVLAGIGCTVVARSKRSSRGLVLVLCVLAAVQLVELFDPAVIHARPRHDDLRVRDVLWMVAFAVAVLARPRSEWLLGAILVVATSASSWRTWSQANAAHLVIDINRVRHGVAIRQATSPEATIATTPCGSIPYFARRRTLDLLGKSDVTIAHQRPRTARFHPGHVKWDYEHSIRDLQPDLVDEVFIPPDKALVEADLNAMPAWGYQRISPAIFVRRGTPYVDARRLLELLRPR